MYCTSIDQQRVGDTSYVKSAVFGTVLSMEGHWNSIRLPFVNVFDRFPEFTICIYLRLRSLKTVVHLFTLESGKDKIIIVLGKGKLNACVGRGHRICYRAATLPRLRKWELLVFTYASFEHEDRVVMFLNEVKMIFFDDQHRFSNSRVNRSSIIIGCRHLSRHCFTGELSHFAIFSTRFSDRGVRHFIETTGR
jgi:hypothetical protein